MQSCVLESRQHCCSSYVSLFFSPYWARISRPNTQSEFYMTAKQTKQQYQDCLEEICLDMATCYHSHTHHSSQCDMPLRRMWGAKLSPQCHLEKMCNCDTKTLQRKKKIWLKWFLTRGLAFASELVHHLKYSVPEVPIIAT